MHSEICLLSQDSELHLELSELLRAEGIAISLVGAAEQALRRLRNSSTLLLLIDDDLQDRTGNDVLKQVRSSPEFDRNCVALYSRRANEIDRVLAFEFGADNYFIKPMPARELALRLSALLRHAPKKHVAVTELRAGALFLNLQTHEAYLGDEFLDLTALEFRLLSFLMSRSGVVHDRQTLLQEVWRWGDNEESQGVSRTVDTHVKRLRQKLKNCGSLIETVRGVGYRFSSQALISDTSVSDSPQTRHAVVTEGAY